MTIRHVFLLITLFLFGASSAQAQSWQITTPRQVIPVPSNGTTISFPNVNLITGMKYRVHASGVATVSNTGETADASFYISQPPFSISISPTIVPVSMKVVYDGVNDNWYYSFYSSSTFQIGFQKSHVYDADISSLGFPLAFHFFDTKDSLTGASYYNDNSGSILIDVARETPGIAIERDTVDFGKLPIGVPKTLLDSIESYGVDSLHVTGFSLVGAGMKKFQYKSERTPAFFLAETTNEFKFTYTPTGSMRDSAEFHFFSSNGFGADTEKVIYLYGEGVNSKLAFNPDTLDFGTVKTGSVTTLADTILNLNSLPVTITSITPITPGSAFSISSALPTIAAKSQGFVNVTFAPPTIGAYIETFNVTTSDGSLFHFYAKGIAGVPQVDLEKNVLDFGQVVLKQSRTLTDEFGNIGTAPMNIVSTLNTNPLEYTIIGNQGPITYEPGHSIIYSVIFSPQVHIPFCQNHDGKFVLNFDDGTSTTITFLGCDHQPLDVLLQIDTTYFITAGKAVTVNQHLVNPGDPLDSTLIPVTSLSERITYDPNLFDLVSVNKGLLIADPAWNMTSTPSNGAVDITINSLTQHFGPAGQLLALRFQSHSDDIPGQFTNLAQGNINFGNPFEPFALSDAGRITISSICFPVSLVSGDMATSIEQNNPNPFTASTDLHYAVGKNADGSVVNVRITLYDQLGRFAGELVNEPKTPGMYDYKFDASSYSSGAYSYVFQAGDHVERKTMILAK